MTTHEKNVLDDYFQEMVEGRKQFEIRLRQENIRIGDQLLLREITSDGAYTGREIKARIKYMLPVSRVEKLYGMSPLSQLEVWGLDKIRMVKGGEDNSQS
ncbi:MAG: DUF3850 domain-containing protein [Actinomycetota bacterium]|nr:DUF3850 domain-containing protein [Actinomycetota bacterium]